MTKILKSILDWNTWLEIGYVPESLLGIKRDIDILKYLNFKEIKTLTGARRTGKSTLLYQVINEVWKENKNILYLNFDDEILKSFDLEEIMETFLQKRNVEYLFLDEIQNCKNWIGYIRKVYDLGKFKQIWITGSNSNLIQQEYSGTLTGRILNIKVNTLSFKEFLRFKNEQIYDIDFLSSEKIIKIKRYFEEFLKWGAFPEIAKRDGNKKELLINYFEDFLYKDIVGRYQVSADKIKKLAYYLLSNSSKLFSYRKLAGNLSLNIESIQDYLSYFYEIFLFDELKKFDFSYKKQLIGAKKIYSLDTGFLNLGFNFTENIGRNLENLVFIELKRRGKEVYYYKKKKECDFLLFDGQKIIEANQVTYSLEDEETKRREISGLLEAMKEYNLKEGTILTYDDEEKDLEIGGKIVKFRKVWRWMLNF